MEFIEFKLPKEFGKLLSPDHFISSIIKDREGFRIAFAHNKDDVSDIVFDFGYYVEDYRVSREGRRLDHHMSKLPERWIFVEVKDSEYLKKLNEEADGMLLFIDPDLKHYMAGDVDSSVDIISRAEPKVYKVKSLYKSNKKNKKE